MKMKYLQNKEKNKNNFRYIVALLIFVPIIFLWRDDVKLKFSEIIFKVSVPFLKFDNYISDSFASVLIAFENKKQLTRTNQDLLLSLEITKNYRLENRLLKEDIETLKKLLGRGNVLEANIPNSGVGLSKKENKEQSILLGYVIGGPVFPPYDSLIIDIGGEKGVLVGDKILSEIGFILGEVVEVYDESSKVKLLSSYGQKTNVFLGDNKTMVEIIGTGSGNFYVSLPKDFSIKKDDPAIYSWGGVQMIALVNNVEYKEGEKVKKVFLKGPFNIRDIRIVGVLKNIK